MSVNLRSRVTVANLCAGTALFVVLGGPAVAADTAASATRVITGKQVKNNSLTGKDVKDRSLLAKDFGAGQLPGGATGQKGDTGPQGATGAQGERGAQGEPGATDVIVRRAESAVSAGTTTFARIRCDAGETPTGGGGGFQATGVGHVEISRPVKDPASTPIGNVPDTGNVPDGWQVQARNSSATGQTLEAWVLCARP